MRSFLDGSFKIGLFGANLAGGLAATHVPERWRAAWTDNLKLASMADETGVDFLLPVARWTGYGTGDDAFHQHVLDSTIWATGLLALTKRITVFSTIHTAFTHPIVAAKHLVTADHVSSGRMGLNIVAGWNQPEYEMFGMELPEDHNDRYGYSQEWLDVVENLWSSREPFDFEGRFFQLKNVTGDPKPFDGRPPILNAGGSPQGQAFAHRNADVLFTVADVAADPDKIAGIKNAAKEKYGRKSLGIFVVIYVVCRPTEAEALAYHQHYAVDHADDEAVERLIDLHVKHSRTLPKEAFRQQKLRMAGGHGGYPVIGTPDQVAVQIAELAKAGIGGVAIGMVNYLDELPYFTQEVLPRLREMGLHGLQ